MSMLPGLDVSYAQGANLPWARMREDGLRFVFSRVGQGTRIVDKTFLPNVNAAREEAFETGGYLLFEADADPLDQARQFHRLAAPHVELQPMFDLERVGFRGVDPKTIVANSALWIAETEQLWGQRVLLYACISDWLALGNPNDCDELTRCDLFAAHYGVSKPSIPAPWAQRGWSYWQWDGDGGKRLPDGRDCDFVWRAESPTTQTPPRHEISFDAWVSGLDLTDLARDAVSAAERDRRLRNE